MRILKIRVVRHALIASIAMASASCAMGAGAGAGADSWHCAAPYAHFDNGSRPIPPGTTRITGRVTFRGGDYGPDWTSSMRIGFIDSQDERSGCNCFGFLMRSFPEAPGKVDYFLATGSSDDAFAKRPAGVSEPFEISLDELHGLLVVAVGKDHPDRAQFNIGRIKRDTLKLTCSGADVEVTDLEYR